MLYVIYAHSCLLKMETQRYKCIVFFSQCSWGKENTEISNAQNMQQWQQVVDHCF